MKIYTRSGDAGQTGLFGGRRVAKFHPRVEAYGTVDELNAVLGLAAAMVDSPELGEALRAVQSRLFDLGADLATPPEGRAGAHVTRSREAWAAELEAQIDAMEAGLAPLTTFILPGGSPGSAWLHLARTVCRRAERRVAEAEAAGEDLSPGVLVYLNRLGDWLFVAARSANIEAGVEDIPWHPEQ
jgi:cob(I)alamin adenosyltransferase